MSCCSRLWSASSRSAGWRPGKAWLFVGLGLLCQVIADAAFLFQSATNTYVPGALFDVLWPLAVLLIAWAAWQEPDSSADRHEAKSWLATPAVAALIAIAILVYDHYHRQNPLAIVFSVATLVVILVRLRMTFRENESMLRQIRRQAVTDALTGLGNRRSLVTDLERALDGPEGAPERILVIFDLNGFKRYNDTFGHPSGDQLLRRLSERLALASAPYGAAYRLGGDEFCVLAVVPDGRSGRAARGDDHGIVGGRRRLLGDDVARRGLPSRGSRRRRARRSRLADQRLYAHKHSFEFARSRPHEVLLQAISEREPTLLEHSRAVARLSLDVGRRLGLDERELEELRIAAELHDVGKLAIPDAILEKPGPLDADEWEFVRRHTLVGQRIVAASPALKEVARVIRASHERWDGQGYDDRLAGEEIPLAARIIFACDAFEAMTTERPYRERLDQAEAVAVMRREAGTQFDPVVVATLCDAVAARVPKCSPSDPAPREATRAS